MQERQSKDHDLWYGPGPPAELGEFPCAVCRTGVGSNSIFCKGLSTGCTRNAMGSSA